VTAFLAAPKHGWLVFVIGCAVLGIAAIAFSPHRYRCCGQSFDSNEALDRHLRHTHHE
jgi:hypothetical protein